MALARWGGYDIFVTRYNTNTDSYLMPENVGMPFNSPYNDYMYVIDEFNDLGWFASDRYQPEGKVCIYVFIPNSSKQVYNYEGMDPDKMISLAQLHSIKDTWTDTDAVKGARERLWTAANAKPRTTKKHDFQFIIDDHSTYYQLDDFRSPTGQSLVWQIQSAGAELQTTAGETGRYAFGILPSQQAGKGQDVRRHPRPGATCTAIVH